MEKKHFNGWLDSLTFFTNPSQVLEMDVYKGIEVFDGYLLNSLHSFSLVFFLRKNENRQAGSIE